MKHQATATAGRAGSDRFYELGEMTTSRLETLFIRGTTPELSSLVGFEFRGMNVPGWAKLLGIKKFIKGFFGRDDKVMGYNTPVAQDDLSMPWSPRPSEQAPKRFGFYRVDQVDATARDNAYLHAVLLDYGRGGNQRLDPTRGLRDYLVQVDADNPDLFLGKAYYAVGPARIATNFFVLERRRRSANPPE